MSKALAKAGALPSIERARELLSKARSTDEVMKIRVLAQAVASVRRGTAAGVEAAEIVLLAKARIGELTSELAQAPNEGGPKRKSSSVKKHDSLAAEGLSRKDAAECEAIRRLKDAGDLENLLRGVPGSRGAADAYDGGGAGARSARRG